MSIVMKKKFSATALAIATIMGLGYSTMALADSAPVDFNASVKVISDQKCELNVKADSVQSWDLTWTKAATNSSIAYGSASTAPLFINVNTSNDSVAPCKLNSVHVGTNVTESSTVAPDNDAVYRQPVGASGFWRFSPVLAKIDLYSDNAFATNVNAAAGALTIMDAQGNSHTQAATPAIQQTNRTESTSLLGFTSVGAVSLTDNYISANGFVPLSVNQGGEVSYSMANTNVDIHSMKIGVGVILAKDPENATGTVDKEVPVDGDVVTMPWVMTVTLS